MSESRVGRTRAVGLAVAAGLAVTATLFTASAASAATVTATGCNTAVAANAGDTLAISGRSVSPIVEQAAKDNNTLLSGVDPTKLKQQTDAIASIPVGTAANAALTKVPGSVIAEAVATALDKAQGYGGVPLLGLGNKKAQILAEVQQKIGGVGVCTMQADTANYHAPGSTPGAPSTGPAGGATGGAPLTPQEQVARQIAAQARLQQLVNTGQVPMRNYANLPSAIPGAYAPPPAARYGLPIPGYGPTKGQLGVPQQQLGADPVRTAGQAQAIGQQRTPSPVGLPMLLAVIAVAGVAGALVRTWALRKISN